MNDLVLFIAGIGCILIGIKLAPLGIEFLIRKEKIKKSFSSYFFGGFFISSILQSSTPAAIIATGLDNKSSTLPILLGAQIGSAFAISILIAIPQNSISQIFCSVLLLTAGIVIAKNKQLGMLLAGVALILTGVQVLKVNSAILTDFLIHAPLYLEWPLGVIFGLVFQTGSPVAAFSLNLPNQNGIIAMSGAHFGAALMSYILIHKVSIKAKRVISAHLLFTGITSVILIGGAFIDQPLFIVFPISVVIMFLISLTFYKKLDKFLKKTIIDPVENWSEPQILDPEKPTWKTLKEELLRQNKLSIDMFMGALNGVVDPLILEKAKGISELGKVLDKASIDLHEKTSAEKLGSVIRCSQHHERLAELSTLLIKTDMKKLDEACQNVLISPRKYNIKYDTEEIYESIKEEILKSQKTNIREMLEQAQHRWQAARIFIKLHKRMEILDT